MVISKNFRSSPTAGISQEQSQESQGIDQINKAVAEMNQVTQQNGLSAQELASTMAVF
jgi:methyl-accepting chemotaxis protein